MSLSPSPAPGRAGRRDRGRRRRGGGSAALKAAKVLAGREAARPTRRASVSASRPANSGLDIYNIRERLAAKGLRIRRLPARKLNHANRHPCTVMRGGTSKGLYFLESGSACRHRPARAVLLAAMGSPDARQIDGMGGAHPLTSKVAVVSRLQPAGRRRGLSVPAGRASTSRGVDSQNCGNILAGVGPFAIEQGPGRSARRASHRGAHPHGQYRRLAWRRCRRPAGRSAMTGRPDRRRAWDGRADPHRFPGCGRLQLRRPSAHRPRARRDRGGRGDLASTTACRWW